MLSWLSGILKGPENEKRENEMEIEKTEKFKMMANDLIKYWCPSYRFKWGKGKNLAGYCNYTKRIISVSKAMVKINSYEEMLLTMVHEIAHALTEGNHHNKVWQQKCVEIGGDGQKYYDASRKIQPKKWVLIEKETRKSIGFKRFRRFKIDDSKYEWKLEG